MRLFFLTLIAAVLTSCSQQVAEPKSQITAVVAETPAVQVDDYTLPKNPPTKADAEQWYQDFRAAKDKVFDGLFIKKTEEHIKLKTELHELTDRATKLFGEPMTSKLSYCTIVATDLTNAWEATAEIVRTGDIDRNPPNNIARAAWSGGEKYGECLDTIDLLK